MSLAVAKKPAKPDKPPEKRKPGRPPTGIETGPLSCRAPQTLIAAFELLSEAVGTGGKGAELLRAAEAYMLRRYWIIKDDPGSKLLNSQHVNPFLAAAEAYFKEAGNSPPKREGAE